MISRILSIQVDTGHVTNFPSFVWLGLIPCGSPARYDIASTSLSRFHGTLCNATSSSFSPVTRILQSHSCSLGSTASVLLRHELIYTVSTSLVHTFSLLPHALSSVALPSPARLPPLPPHTTRWSHAADHHLRELWLTYLQPDSSCRLSPFNRATTSRSGSSCSSPPLSPAGRSTSDSYSPGTHSAEIQQQGMSWPWCGY